LEANSYSHFTEAQKGRIDVIIREAKGILQGTQLYKEQDQLSKRQADRKQ
jgi:hypothetical protein